MTTLDDLRSTLEERAGTIHDAAGTARVAAVRGRARAVRRRRTAGAALAAALVVGVGTLAALPRGAERPEPADSVFGIDVPQTMTSLDWTYRLDSVAEGSGTVSVELPASDLPRLISWATETDDQTVILTKPSGRLPASSRDFGDFTLVEPGEAATVTVRSEGQGLALAAYALDLAKAPRGVGTGALVFREQVADAPLLGATWAEGSPASVSFVAPGGPVSIASVCRGASDGTRAEISFSDEAGSISGGCAEAAFDPGAHASTTTSFPKGERVTVTMRASDRVEGVGLAVYSRRFDASILGSEVPTVREADGHEWSLGEEHQAGRINGGLSVPLGHEPVDRLVGVVMRSRGRVGLTWRAGSSPLEQVSTEVDGPQSFGPVLLTDLDRKPRLDVRAAPGASGRLSVLTYTRAD